MSTKGMQGTKQLIIVLRIKGIQGGKSMYNILVGLQIIVSIVLIVSVLMQPSKTQGITGMIQGGSETFFAKNKTRTFESTMSRLTVISAVLFTLITIGINLINK